MALFSLIFIEEEFQFTSVDFLVIHSASFPRYTLSATPLREFDPFLSPLCPMVAAAGGALFLHPAGGSLI